jgi:hypothetical protein
MRETEYVVVDPSTQNSPYCIFHQPLMADRTGGSRFGRDHFLARPLPAWLTGCMEQPLRSSDVNAHDYANCKHCPQATITTKHVSDHGCG